MPDLPEVIRISLYRFVQEAVINIIKHAHADAVQVKLSCLPGQIQLSVNDNGKGIDPELHTNGIGLLGIRERIQLIGGHLNVISKQGKGTRLTATVPWTGNTS
jgi:signal transduction histidine kinase